MEKGSPIHPFVLLSSYPTRWSCVSSLIPQESPPTRPGLPGPHIKIVVNNEIGTAHLFEYTISFGIDPNLHFKCHDTVIVWTQIILCQCMKEKINGFQCVYSIAAGE